VPPERLAARTRITCFWRTGLESFTADVTSIRVSRWGQRIGYRIEDLALETAN